MQPVLNQYLSDVLSQTVQGLPLESEELRGVPQYLANRYSFSRVRLVGRFIVFVEPRGQSSLTPSSVGKDLQQLEDRLGEPVAIIREQLASWERGRYITAGIPFVVPGEQLFLPMLFLDLRDVKRRPMTEVKHLDYLTWSAQTVALRHLLSGDVEDASLQDLAERFGYSRMTLTKVQRELESHGLCRVTPVGRTKQLVFELDHPALWEKLLSVARSPVRERLLANRCDTDLPSSGLSALAARTDISDDSRPVFAATASQVKDLKANKLIETTPDPDAAVVILEVWNYDPSLLSIERMVDPLSLYLSLREDPDERVQAALESMMETLSWSKV
ncbi:MAG: hypothetical protein JJT94_17715 [Bernardetiaceae bacterium]|nr:hypothetical protein [Bernardetiaceae bacterium]